MARWFSNWAAVRHGWKGGNLYLIVAIVLFAVVVFLLFRGHSSGPQEAAADVATPETPVVAESAPVVPVSQPVVNSTAQSQPVAAPQNPPSAPVQLQPTVVPQPVVQPAAAPNPQAESGHRGSPVAAPGTAGSRDRGSQPG